MSEFMLKFLLWVMGVLAAACVAVMLVQIFDALDSQDNPKCYADTANAVLPAIHAASVKAAAAGDRERHEFWDGIESSILEKVMQERSEEK